MKAKITLQEFREALNYEQTKVEKKNRKTPANSTLSQPFRYCIDLIKITIARILCILNYWYIVAKGLQETNILIKFGKSISC